MGQLSRRAGWVGVLLATSACGLVGSDGDGSGPIAVGAGRGGEGGSITTPAAGSGGTSNSGGMPQEIAGQSPTAGAPSGEAGSAGAADRPGKPSDPECAAAIAYTSDIEVWTRAELDKLPLIYRAEMIQIHDAEHLDRLKCLTSLRWLGISGTSQLKDLHGLERLQLVTEGVLIQQNAALLSLSGLEALHTATGKLTPAISINENPELRDLSGLQGLRSATGLEIGGNAKLESLHGLGPLKETESLAIASNPALQTLAGLQLERIKNLGIQRNDSLTNLDGLASLSDVWGNLLIAENRELVSLAGLHGLTGLPYSLQISSNPKLRELSGLDGLRKLTSLYVAENDALENIDALAVVEVGELTLGGPSLTGIAGLQQLTAVSKLQIAFAPGVTSLGALANLKHADAVILVDTGLTDLAGLEHAHIDSELTVDNNLRLRSLTGLNPDSPIRTYLTVTRNPLLSDLTGLELVKDVRVKLWIAENDGLRSLSGLEQLISAGTLRIDQNPALISIAELHSLQSVPGTLSIAGNAALPACQAQGLADRVTDAKTSVELSGNDATGICD